MSVAPVRGARPASRARPPRAGWRRTPPRGALPAGLPFVLPFVLAALLLALPAAAPGARAQDAPDNWLPNPMPVDTFDSLDVNLFPILFYTPETRVGAGIGTWIISRDPRDDGNGKPDNLWMNVVYTQEQQLIVQVIPEYFFRHGTYRLKAWFRYMDFPTRFYGIGHDAPASAEEAYTPLTRSANFIFTRRVYEELSLGVLLDFNDTRILRTEAGGLLDSGMVLGAEGSRILGLGAIASWDSREHHFNPRAGSLLEFTTLRYRELETDAYRFWRSGLDVRRYLPITDADVLSLHGLLQTVRGEAPFTALPQLGGKFVMRGFFEGRYRDENLLVLQAEYRLQLYERWGAAIFLSAGDVSDSLRSFSLGDFRLAGGLGLRYAYNVKERINLRLDVAVTEESSGVYFSVGEAF